MKETKSKVLDREYQISVKHSRREMDQQDDERDNWGCGRHFVEIIIHVINEMR